MSRFFYDMHMHSCLSPCADNDNTPNNLAGMASLCGLNIAALTDHNSAKNCPAFFTAAARYGIIPIAGTELTTSEDIHVVCLFETLEGALEFDRALENKRMPIKNRPDIFGEQLITDGEDNIIGTEDSLLSFATALSLEDVPREVAKFGGICYPAHVDRPSNGAIAVLGAFPETPYFSCAEIHNPEKVEEYRGIKVPADKRIITGSDAHCLTDLRDAHEFFELDCSPDVANSVRKKLFEFLR